MFKEINMKAIKILTQLFTSFSFGGGGGKSGNLKAVHPVSI